MPKRGFKLEVYQSDANSDWYWRLLARNGKVIADGSEGYVSLANAMRAARNVQKGLASAEIVKEEA